MTDHESIETVHGEVEYEVAECAGCGQEFKKDDMERVFLGDLKKGYQRHEYYRMEFYDEPTVLRFCDVCTDEPVRLELPSVFWSEKKVMFVVGIITTLLIQWWIGVAF